MPNSPGYTQTERQAVCAFFDFDETLVEEKSMFSFLRYYIDNGAPFKQTFDEIFENIKRQKYDNVPREEINSFFYSLFKDHSRTEFRRAAEKFVNAGGLTPKPQVVARMNEHLRRGETVVIVSGSSLDIIASLLSRWGISETLCTEQQTYGDYYTGQLVSRAIGRHKAERVKQYCRERGIMPSICFAYGDDISDAPMLSGVGHPVAVDPEPGLLGVARHNGWEILSTTEGSCL